MRAPPILVACCLLLAGCNGLPATAGDEDGTLTPVPVPNETDSGDALPTTGYPPGVTSTQVENVGALVAAHEAALENRSYVWVERRNVLAGTNGSDEIWTYMHLRATVGTDSRFRATVRRRGDPSAAADPTAAWHNWSLYANDSTQFFRMTNRTDTTYTVRERRIERDQIAMIATGSLRRLVGSGPAIVERVEVDGRSHVRIRRRGEADRLPTGVEGSDTYVAELLVTPSGFVRRLDVRFRPVDADGVDVATYSFRYRRGVDRVERPAWTDDALANATVTSPRRDAE